jgi:hypothetical protein
LEEVKTILRRHEDLLLAKANVLGVGIGQESDACFLVALVRAKVPVDQLDKADLIPSSLDGIRVRVREIGDVKAQDS